MRLGWCLPLSCTRSLPRILGWLLGWRRPAGTLPKARPASRTPPHVSEGPTAPLQLRGGARGSGLRILGASGHSAGQRHLPRAFLPDLQQLADAVSAPAGLVGGMSDGEIAGTQLTRRGRGSESRAPAPSPPLGGVSGREAAGPPLLPGAPPQGCPFLPFLFRGPFQPPQRRPSFCGRKGRDQGRPRLGQAVERGLEGQDGLAGRRWRRRRAGRGGGSDGLGVVAWGAGCGRWVLGLKRTDQRAQLAGAGGEGGRGGGSTCLLP